MALWIIGPRQMIASSSFSWEEGHRHDFDSEALRRDHPAVLLNGTFGDAKDTRLRWGNRCRNRTSATSLPCFARVAARLTAIVVLPTPPLPL